MSDLLGLSKAEKSLDKDLNKGLDGLQKGLDKDMEKMDNDIEDLEKSLNTDLSGLQKQMVRMTSEIKDIASQFQQSFENAETQSEKVIRKVGAVLLAGSGVVLYMNSSDPVFSTTGALCILMGISFILN
jgi:predicted  nucleic acid-binding Zn-ribbon protein